MRFTRGKNFFTRNNKNKSMHGTLFIWQKKSTFVCTRRGCVHATYKFLMGTNSFQHDNEMFAMPSIPFIRNQFLCEFVYSTACNCHATVDRESRSYNVEL